MIFESVDGGEITCHDGYSAAKDEPNVQLLVRVGATLLELRVRRTPGHPGYQPPAFDVDSWRDGIGSSGEPCKDIGGAQSAS